MTSHMTPKIVKTGNGEAMEIRWPLGMKIISGLMTMLLGVGVLAAIDMRTTLAVLATSTEAHIKSPMHAGSVSRTEIEHAHEMCRDQIDDLRDRIRTLEAR